SARPPQRRDAPATRRDYCVSPSQTRKGAASKRPRLSCENPIVSSDDQRAPLVPLPPFWASGAWVPVFGLLVALGCVELPEVPPPIPVSVVALGAALGLVTGPCVIAFAVTSQGTAPARAICD